MNWKAAGMATLTQLALVGLLFGLVVGPRVIAYVLIAALWGAGWYAFYRAWGD